MTKTVVNNSQVPHLWANQSQDHAKGGGSISFSGRSIYSYEAEIGRLVDAPDGSRVALLISRRWSVTTSSHQSRAASAVHHLVHFTVPRLDVSAHAHAENMAYLVKEYSDRIASLKRSRNAPDDYQYTYSSDAANSAFSYALAFGLVAPTISVVADHEAVAFVHNTPDKVAKREARAVQLAAQNATRVARLRVARAEAIAANIVAIEDWRAGARSDLPYDASTDAEGGALVRINRAGDTLQTSQGAEVPLVDAIKVFRRVAACRAAGVEWHRNGDQIRVGSFQVDAITSDGSFRAGCHSFNWTEIESLAKKIGLFEVVA